MGHCQSAGGDTNNSVHKEREWKVKRRVKQQIKKGSFWHKRINLNSLIALILCKLLTARLLGVHGSPEKQNRKAKYGKI